MLWYKKKEMALIEEIQIYKKTIEDLAKDRDVYKERCIDIEDKIGDDYGVKIRQEITQVNVDFNLMELTILYTAICKLMERPMITEDLQYYLALRIKIEGLLQQVKE